MSNNKIFVKSAVLGYINMIIVMLIGIISQPMMLNQLGPIEFGIWTVSLNVLAYIGNTNVGIPGAALVYIAKSRNNTFRKEIVKKSFKLLNLVSIIVGISFIIIIILFPKWFLIIGDLSVEYYSIARTTMIISIVLFLIRSPLQLAQSAFSGFQDIHINKIYEILNTIVPFGSLLLIVIYNKSIIELAFFSGIGYIIVNLVATIHLIIRYKFFVKIDIIEDIKEEENVGYKELLISGSEFFIIGIGAALIYNTDNLVISNFVNVAKIPNYNFAFKLYQMAVQVMNIFTGISMPLYANAFANKNYKWIKKIYYNMTTVFPIFSGAIWIGGMIIGRDILEVWARDKTIFENYMLLFFLGGFVYSLSVVNVNSTFLSGIDRKKELAKLIWIEALCNLVLSILLSKLMGISGVALGTLLSSLLIPFVFLPRYIKKYTDSEIVFNFKNLIRHLSIAVFPILIIVTIFTEFIYKQGIINKAIIVIVVMIIYFIISYFSIEEKYRNEYIRLILKKIKKNKID